MVAFFVKFRDVLTFPKWPNSKAGREKRESFDGIKRTETNSVTPGIRELTVV
jgi:hypothetical protein